MMDFTLRAGEELVTDEGKVVMVGAVDGDRVRLFVGAQLNGRANSRTAGHPSRAVTPAPCWPEILEVPLLLPASHLEALSDRGARLGLTAGHLIRRLIGGYLGTTADDGGTLPTARVAIAEQ